MSQALLTLLPRPWKWLGVVFGCLLFVGAGIWMQGLAIDGAAEFKAWACIVFFGLIACVGLLQLIPGATQVVITEEGLFTTTMFRTRFLGWSRIDRFGVIERTQWHGPFRRRQRQVGILFVVPEEGGALLEKGASWSFAMTGFHGALPDNYGYKHQELADLLNRYLEAYRNTQKE